jgi:MFS superfamily sulfate permease-like transporter
MTTGPLQEPDDYIPPPVTPSFDYGKTKVNWVAVAVIVVIVAGLAFVSVVAAAAAGLVIALVLVVNNTGTGNWVIGGIGDDTRAARGPRRKGPPDY